MQFSAASAQQGYVSTSGRPLTVGLQRLFWAFAGLALIAGVLLFVLSEHTDDWWSWTITPPLTAAFLGASYWAACVLLAWTARRSSWERARATVVPVALIAVLLLIATLIHLDRFDLDSLFGVFWLTVYILVPPVLVALVWRQLRVPGDPAPRGEPLPAALRGALALQAAVMLGVGIALYVAPSTADTVWPWTLTPLTARAVGAFVIGFGAAAAHAVVENDVTRFEGAAYAYATLGALELVALARYSDTLHASAVGEAAYFAFAVSVLAVGVSGSLRARRLQGG